DLAAFQADGLAASGEASPVGCLVLRAIDTDANGLKALAMAVSAKPGNIVVLVSTSRPVLVVAARSADVVGASAQPIVAALTARCGGRGGGRPELAQAGGLDGDADAVLAVARDAILPRPTS